MDSHEVVLDVVKVLSWEQHNALVFKAWIECVGLKDQFPIRSQTWDVVTWHPEIKQEMLRDVSCMKFDREQHNVLLFNNWIDRVVNPNTTAHIVLVRNNRQLIVYVRREIVMLPCKLFVLLDSCLQPRDLRRIATHPDHSMQSIDLHTICSHRCNIIKRHTDTLNFKVYMRFTIKATRANCYCCSND